MTARSRKLFNIILALLVSLGAWMFVVYNYYPMTDVRYTDVPLTYEGQRDLAARGLAVSEASTEGITVRLNQRRVNFNNYSASDITVVADVGECVAGENDVSINVIGPRDTRVSSYDTDTIKVTVERAESDYMDIDVIYSESNSDSDVPLVVDIDREGAEVVCASSKLSSIKKVAAVLDKSEVGTGVKSYTARLVALDKDGSIVPYAVIYPEEISLDARAGALKTVDLDVKVTGGSDDDYERKYTAPDKIKIIGPADEISKINSISTEEVNINEYYVDYEIALEPDMPEGVRLQSGEEEPVLKLTVTRIEKEESEESAEDTGRG